MERLALNALIEWDKKPYRKPLIIYGARQVGKTYLIKEIFAKRFYPEKTVYINFKFDDDIRDFVNGEGDYTKPTSNAAKIMDHIALRNNKEITPDTLLIFDEIQEALPAITALKDFKENHPEIRIIATGSLVRIKIRRKSKKEGKFFYPVGAIEEFTLSPMNFEEFLMNANQMLYRRIVSAYEEKEPLEESAHNLALEYLRNYLLVGSLPENIDIFLKERSLLAARKNLASIYRDYLNDIDLYDVPTGMALRTRKLFSNLFMEINRPHADFKPSLFDEGKKVRDYATPMNLLVLAEVVHLCKKTKERVSLPLREDEGSNYRIYMLDTGFLAYQSGMEMVDFQNGKNTNMGVFFENYIACELSSYGLDLFYWKGKNDCEFEFLVKYEGSIVPIDVKKSRGSLSSMRGYASHNPAPLFVKVSANRYGYDPESTTLTIPLYSFFLFAKELEGPFRDTSFNF